MFVNVNSLPETLLHVVCGGLEMKWLGFDVKTRLCPSMSWVVWDRLLHQSELLSLSVLICKMQCVMVTLLGLERMSEKSLSTVSATQEALNT